MQFPDRASAARALAAAAAERLRDGVEARGSASIVVSGGESPLTMFAQLRALPVPWEFVTVVPSDERWVAVEEAASNEGMIRRELLVGPASAAKLVSLHRAGSASGALPALNASLASIGRPFDVVVLGVGADGHTASLFPDSPDLAVALYSTDDVVAQQPPRLAQARVSLTPRALLDAREIALLFFGAEKRAVYERVRKPGSIAEYPLRAIMLQRSVRVTAYWAP